jgi:hypothetical protein
MKGLLARLFGRRQSDAPAEPEELAPYGPIKALDETQAAESRGEYLDEKTKAQDEGEEKPTNYS